MAEGKKTFILYCDMIHNFEPLSDEEAGKLIKHIFKYVNDQKPKASDRLIEIVFEPIRQRLKKDLVGWQSKAEKLSESGKLGGIASAEARRIKSNNDQANASSMLQNEHGTVNVTDIVTGLVNDTEKDQTLFDLFWILYDKKVGKEKAFTKWKKLKQSERDAAMLYIPKYNIAQPNKQYRKDPCTFINNKSWNDELIQREEKPIKSPEGHPNYWDERYMKTLIDGRMISSYTNYLHSIPLYPVFDRFKRIKDFINSKEEADRLNALNKT